MKLLNAFPLLKNDKKKNERQDSQQTLFLSEQELTSNGVFITNVNKDANSKASMKEILKLLKSPESLMGGKSVSDYNYLNGYGNCYFIHE
jgi:hypothetical protein